MYEDDTLDKEMFRSRLQDLDIELDQLHHRKSEIELELGDDQSHLISVEEVKVRLLQLETLLKNASTEQIKTLLHLVIGKITVGEDKAIETIEINFTEKVQQHFIKIAPSGENPEGAFDILVQKLNVLIAFRIEI